MMGTSKFGGKYGDIFKSILMFNSTFDRRMHMTKRNMRDSYKFGTTRQCTKRMILPGGKEKEMFILLSFLV